MEVDQNHMTKDTLNRVSIGNLTRMNNLYIFTIIMVNKYTMNKL